MVSSMTYPVRSNGAKGISNMGYKILDVKADIHEDVEAYFNQLLEKPLDLDKLCLTNDELKEMLREDVLDIVDKHFEKIER